MNVKKHNFIHDRLHDIPIPPQDELEKIYVAMNYVKANNPYDACMWLASMSDFGPFKSCMLYQAELIKQSTK